MEIKVIHLSEVLKTMNKALLNHQTVSFKAWKVGRDETDPERGELKTYDHVYVTSHSRNGTYNILDPLAESEDMKHRHVCEALISEFMGKKVIW
jgi:hypothetical protein